MGVPGLCVRMRVHTHPRLCEEQSFDHPEVTDTIRMTPVPGWHPSMGMPQLCLSPGSFSL